MGAEAQARRRERRTRACVRRWAKQPLPRHEPAAPPEKRLLLEQRALQWAAAERAADDRAAELERATEMLGTSSGSGDIGAYVEAQARARVAGKIEDDTREWLLEAARALLP